MDTRTRAFSEVIALDARQAPPFPTTDTFIMLERLGKFSHLKTLWSFGYMECTNTVSLGRLGTHGNASCFLLWVFFLVTMFSRVSGSLYPKTIWFSLLFTRLIFSSRRVVADKYQSWEFRHMRKLVSLYVFLLDLKKHDVW